MNKVFSKVVLKFGTSKTDGIKSELEMNEKGEFTYKNKPCGIVYSDKKFFVAVYKDSKRLIAEKIEFLFPASNLSKEQQLTAFHVAKSYVLPEII